MYHVNEKYVAGKKQAFHVTRSTPKKQALHVTFNISAGNHTTVCLTQRQLMGN